MLSWKKSTDKSSTTSAAPSAAPGGPAVIYEFSRWTGSRSTAIHPPSPTGVTLKKVKGVLLPDGLRHYAAQNDVLRVRLGDAVFLASSDQEPFIGLVNRLFRDRFRSRNLVEIQWFYKLDGKRPALRHSCLRGPQLFTHVQSAAVGQQFVENRQALIALIKDTIEQFEVTISVPTSTFFKLFRGPNRGACVHI